MASRDQSGILLFPRRGKHRAEKGAKEVPGIAADDKRALTIDFALTADGQVVPPQVIFEGTTDRCHRENTCYFEKNGWLIRHSCNHWSNTDLALEYLENIEQHFHEQKVRSGMFHELLVFCLRFLRSLFCILT